MNLEWLYNCDNVNWNELSNLYKIAPLGDKKPNDLKTAFSNSMFKGHNKIILYSNQDKEEFYSKLGFDKMNTAMAIFKNKKQAIESQLTRKTPNE